MIKKNSILTFLIFIFISGIHLHAFAQDQIQKEKRIKAAYIFNFAKLVEWPETVFDLPTSPLCLGIIGDDPLTDTLMGIENKIANGRAISIKKYQNIEEIGQCHILYIGESEKKHLKQTLKKLQSKPFLTVSNIDGFADLGGMINFILINNRVRFEINLQITRYSNLKVSSRLLKIATIVGETEREKKK